jgi:CheY-like chemotaxis protein
MAEVLIIEDDRDLLDQLGRLFRGRGHGVTLAADGQDGLARLGERRFDLIVTDLIMDRRDGLETIMAARARFPRTRIIAISGARLGGFVLLEMAAHVGADATLEKPFSGEDLLALAERLLAGT